MKQKDIMTIGLVAFVSIIVSLVVTNLIFNGSKNQTVENVPSITSYFPTPDSHYFNSNSIDPTQLIEIGNGVNPTPFNQPTQG